MNFQPISFFQYFSPFFFQPVVTSVRQIYYEPQPPVFEPAPAASISVPVAAEPVEPAEPEPSTETRRVVPQLRPIIPDFDRAGLRRDKADIGFLRPDQVKPLPQRLQSPIIISF